MIGKHPFTGRRFGFVIGTTALTFLVKMGVRLNSLRQADALNEVFADYDKFGNPDLEALGRRDLPKEVVAIMNEDLGAGHEYSIRTPAMESSPEAAMLAAEAPAFLLMTLASLFPNSFALKDAASLQEATEMLRSGRSILVQLGKGNVVQMGSFAHNSEGNSHLVAMVARTTAKHVFTGVATWVIQVDKETGAVACQWVGRGKSSYIVDSANNVAGIHLFSAMAEVFPKALEMLAKLPPEDRATLTVDGLAKIAADAVKASRPVVYAGHTILGVFDQLTPFVIQSKHFLKQMHEAPRPTVVNEYAEGLIERITARTIPRFDPTDNVTIRTGLEAADHGFPGFEPNEGRGTGIPEGFIEEPKIERKEQEKKQAVL